LKAIEKISGEQLQGSGFEDEKPEDGFSGAVGLDSTFLPSTPRAFRSDRQ
jgi:hypothetical protein